MPRGSQLSLRLASAETRDERTDDDTHQPANQDIPVHGRMLAVSFAQPFRAAISPASKLDR